MGPKNVNFDFTVRAHVSFPLIVSTRSDHNKLVPLRTSIVFKGISLSLGEHQPSIVPPKNLEELTLLVMESNISELWMALKGFSKGGYTLDSLFLLLHAFCLKALGFAILRKSAVAGLFLVFVGFALINRNLSVPVRWGPTL